MNLPQITRIAEQLTTDGHLEREYLDLLNTLFCGLIAAGCALLLLATKWLVGWSSRLFEPVLLQSLAIVALVFACTSPFVFLDYRHSAADIFYEYRHAKIGAAAQYAEGASIANRTTVQENLVSYTKQLWIDFGPVAIFSLIEIALWAYRDRRLAIGVGLLPVITFVTIVNSGNTADRYLLPIYPALCLAGVAGMYVISSTLSRAPLWAAGAYGASCLLIGGALYAQLTFFGLPDTRSLAHAWIATHVPAGSLVANENYTQTPSLGDLPVTQVLANRTFDLAERWDGQADYLLVGAAGTVDMPRALDTLSQRYGPPLMVIAADSRTVQGPSQFVFRLPARFASSSYRRDAPGRW